MSAEYPLTEAQKEAIARIGMRAEARIAAAAAADRSDSATPPGASERPATGATDTAPPVDAGRSDRIGRGTSPRASKASTAPLLAVAPPARSDEAPRRATGRGMTTTA